ncbi:UBP-type zinc finger domain-containing protein [Nitrosopumilus sp. K4]|uniref:UBP-type zinc finger domain-containing protein n=1 Tax=Nitrosopumilus sp. K4 TaxID=2795383 RepID=UPI001BAE0142|nr:UBP-type zinc finger domain-containing protein [Nitrosopumilus sp. K4]
MPKECEHFSEENKGMLPNTKGCEECEKEHLPTVALRMCLTCGHVGCCDSSVGKHATKHFKETRHPVMIAVQENSWKWCYIHEEYY